MIVGLSGCLATQNGSKEPAYDLYVGGGMGRTAALAEQAARRLPPDEALSRIADLLRAGAV